MTLVVKNLSANAEDKRDASSIPGLGRSPGGRHSNLLQYSCLENPVARGGWWATVKESGTTEQLSSVYAEKNQQQWFQSPAA